MSNLSDFGVPLLSLPLNLLLLFPFLLYSFEASNELCELCLLITLEPFLLPLEDVILVVISPNFSSSCGLLKHGNISSIYFNLPLSKLLESSYNGLSSTGFTPIFI